MSGKDDPDFIRLTTKQSNILVVVEAGRPRTENSEPGTGNRQRYPGKTCGEWVKNIEVVLEQKF
jgi:hypothetical protein